jgi:hypothetical protein
MKLYVFARFHAREGQEDALKRCCARNRSGSAPSQAA